MKWESSNIKSLNEIIFISLLTVCIFRILLNVCWLCKLNYQLANKIEFFFPKYEMSKRRLKNFRTCDASNCVTSKKKKYINKRTSNEQQLHSTTGRRHKFFLFFYLGDRVNKMKKKKLYLFYNGT